MTGLRDEGFQDRGNRIMAHWQIEYRAEIAVISFLRPPRNFMSFAALGELAACLEQVRDDPQVRVIVLASRLDGYFVAHADLEDLAKVGRGEPVEGERSAWRTVPSLIEAMPQPVIAAIDGQAWGGGTELSLGCTLRVASPRGSFGLPEIAVAMVPGAGGTQRLPRIVGEGRALEIILSGRKIDADEALAIGLISAIIPQENFLEGVCTWARRISRHHRPALAAVKRAVTEGSRMDFEAGLNFEREMVIPRTADPRSLELREELKERYAQTPPETTVEF
jgi:enoyl-CoA hydratase/carnithine racemase